MAKHKGEIEIGYRMVEELHRLFGRKTDIILRFGIAREMLYAWASGVTPGGYVLAKLHYCGGDVIYVLTGKRSGCDG